MKKKMIIILTATLILTGVSCRTSREVRISERHNDNGIIIKKRKTLRDADRDKDFTIKVKKERKRHRHHEPGIIIDTDR